MGYHKFEKQLNWEVPHEFGTTSSHKFVIDSLPRLRCHAWNTNIILSISKILARCRLEVDHDFGVDFQKLVIGELLIAGRV